MKHRSECFKTIQVEGHVRGWRLATLLGPHPQTPPMMSLRLFVILGLSAPAMTQHMDGRYQSAFLSLDVARCLSIIHTRQHLLQTWAWIRTISGPRATFCSFPLQVSLLIPFDDVETADNLSCSARIVWAYTIGLFSKAPLTTFWYKGECRHVEGPCSTTDCWIPF